MSFPTMNDDLNIIAGLGDEPNEDDGLTAAELKAKFDMAGLLLKAALNQLVGALNAADAAANVGFSSDAVQGGNVKAAIENLRADLVQQMQSITQGGVAEKGITTAMLDDDAVTGVKVAPGTLREDVDGADAMALISTDATSATNNLNLHYVKSLGMVLVDGTIEIVPSAAGQQVTEYGFDSYAPVFEGNDVPSIITPDQAFSTVWLMKQSGTAKLVATAKGIESAEVGQTRTIPVLGWYFCNGEGT